MAYREIGKEQLRAFIRDLQAEEREHSTVEKYQPETVNGKLSALNKFFRSMGWPECRVKYLKIQRKLFRDTKKELTKGEYTRLLETASRQVKTRLALLIEMTCATGIRVSEVRYITAEEIHAGRTDIALKGKIRTILLPERLCRKLQKYAKRQKITSGEVFLTRSRKGISRRQIWAEMKGLCRYANVAATKVFPTTCGTCLRGRSTRRAGTWRSWRTCWGIRASRPPASTWSPRERSTPDSWSGWVRFFSQA